MGVLNRLGRGVMMDDVDCMNIDCEDCEFFLCFDVCGYGYYCCIFDDNWKG